MANISETVGKTKKCTARNIAGVNCKERAGLA